MVRSQRLRSARWTAYKRLEMSRALRCRRAGVTGCQNDFVTEGKKRMKSTSKTNDGFEIIPFHPLLSPHDKEAWDEREREREKGRCAMPAKLFQFHRQFPV